MNKLPLSHYISNSMKSFRLRTFLTLGIFLALVFASLVVFSGLRSNFQGLRLIAAHVSTLVETHDRPELQRLLKSFVAETNNLAMVTENDTLFSTTGALSDLDQPWKIPSGIKITKNILITSQGILTLVPVLREHGPRDLKAKLLLLSPIAPLLGASVILAFAIFCLCMLVSALFFQKLENAIGESLRPLEELNQAICRLRNPKDSETVLPTGIEELDSIRLAILQTQEALANARDALAERKAKALAADAYRHLIHDLHNPVAALGCLVKISSSADQEESVREEAVKKIPLLAEQILNQIDSAKSNLDFEAEIMHSSDLRHCVDEATEQAQLACAKKNLVLENISPSSEIVLPHDSTLLKRAIGNLVRNAIEASNQRVKIVTEQLPREISIRVMDDGPGISPAQAALFLQGRSKSTKGNRQAFGLAAANHIVRVHGGRIIYQNSELGGACFEVRI